jgi:hypothetical protein
VLLGQLATMRKKNKQGYEDREGTKNLEPQARTIKKGRKTYN